jgi:hypothetical protein
MAESSDEEIRQQRINNILPYAFTPENAAENARKATIAREENKKRDKRFTGVTGSPLPVVRQV